MEVAGMNGGGRQVFIGLLEKEPLELTYPGVSGPSRVSGELTPESPARAESPGQVPNQLPVRSGLVAGVSVGV